ncbi:MAG: 16S rRNA (guanine(966)-N(2))-methyltransferase RsmD [Acidobacteria bacterium]|nr:16S rRNA (guanine(966)-N(2))-methyltransferase RsmD [Acidobacteriota bacterium]
MRVIGGEFRSRRLRTIPGLATRPTPDRLRETLFNILAGRIAGVTFLDAYAGSGAVGIEALSRGAARAIFLEKGRRAVEAIQQNVDSLGIANRVQVVHGPVLRSLARYPADIAFLDPPYELAKEYKAALEALAETPAGLVIAQHSVRLALEECYGRLRRSRILKQGDNALSFYSAE